MLSPIYIAFLLILSIVAIIILSARYKFNTLFVLLIVAATVGFAAGFDGENIILTTKQTNCLAQDKCGIPPEKLKVNTADLQTEKTACCTPGSSCC